MMSTAFASSGIQAEIHLHVSLDEIGQDIQHGLVQWLPDRYLILF